MRALLLLLPLLLLLNLSCEVKPQPEPINYGKDSCAFCLMIIADAGFSAELKTKKGKVYKFDAIECMAAYILSGKVKEEDILALWVADFPSKELVRVEEVKFLVSDRLRSPMGLNISAFKKEEELKEAQRNFGGKILTWEEVLRYVGEKWREKVGRARER
jgi:copper chaperone NosL